MVQAEEMTEMSTELTVSPAWVCGVVRSGYHNGAWCSPGEPHDGFWGCGWRYEISVPATPENAKMLQAAGITVTGLPAAAVHDKLTAEHAEAKDDFPCCHGRP